MKLLIYITFVCFLSFGCGTAAQQEQYKTHVVQPGETVYSIAKKYNTTEADIYRLNPDARQGVQTNAVLILPTASIFSNSNENTSFKMHRVKRKETLFSISQLYNVPVEDLKKYNKELYSRQLKKGEKIRIPYASETSSNTVINNTSETSTTSKSATHTVLPKETKFGIARKYGISVAELEKLNPSLGESLPVGMVLKVPNDPVTESAVIEDEKYDFYEVQAKEGFYRLKVKLGLTEEEIIALNPYAKDGLKEGMVLKVPKQSTAVIGSKTEKVDLENYIKNRSKKRVAVLLPFRLQRAESDSTDVNIGLLKGDATLRVALDFYSGVLMAAEFAKDKGISVQLDVYDTEASTSTIGNIISRNNVKEADAVIGPLLRQNVEKAVADLKVALTPVFSPLSNKQIETAPNLFQTLPTEELLQNSMLQYIMANTADKNVILVSDATRSAQKNIIMTAIPRARAVSPRKGNFLYQGDIASKLESGMENWVILESTDPVLVSNVVGLLNGIPASNRVRLFTLDKNEAYDYHDVSNMHLAKLGFTFPSVNRSYNYNEKSAFLISYKNTYGVLPNRYAVRGFDVTLDVLLRLASADDLYEAMAMDVETEYIENKFRYAKKPFSGYENQAVYLIKYTNDLQFEEVR
ncbi:LysM peptidoglycan-binding domain-containing protein [Altibacter sp.]|uniref:LysM peptidoglycan-binding domain-containing protein n=1 Tax=Altibacter sp. TaxID=2024823 RepID=UPI000C93E7D1|nr:LysM peptidoglycan-binding domain-containing protein [Altibacter sp.]MAP54912.1 peptidoglycan-binding protein [Altibacter sp.]